MKKELIFILLFALCSCKKTTVQEDLSYKSLNPTQAAFLGSGVTKEEVTDMMNKHGVREAIETGKFSSFKEGTLKYLNLNYVDYYFGKIKEIMDLDDQMKIFRQQQSTVRTYAEYYALIEQYPAVHKMYIGAAGGMEQYNATKQKDIARKVHIYDLNDGGPLMFIDADKDTKDKGFVTPGKRIDNQPR
jgi:hypothetical protein